MPDYMKYLSFLFIGLLITVSYSQVNPGMGFTTQSSLDGEVPGYPASSIAYYRWYWDELEPEEGKFNWKMVDSVLAEAKAHGQRLATRIMPANGRPRIPDWYRKTGAKGWEFIAESMQLSGKDIASWMPDHEDPLFNKYMGRMVREFAKRYDGHPAYRAYIPVFEIRKAGSRKDKSVLARYETDWDVLKWLPGRHLMTTQLQIPEDTQPARYLVYFALLDPFDKKPAVKLAVTGRDAQNWYSWTSFEVVEKGKLESILTGDN